MSTAVVPRAAAALAAGGPARRNAETGLAIAVVFVIALLILPLPAALLDLFLAASIGLSLVVLGILARRSVFRR